MTPGTRKLSSAPLILVLALALVIMPAHHAQAAGSVSLTALGTPYAQDFDTLASSGTSSTVPTGWDFAESGTNANATYTAGTGSGNAGDTYSFGLNPVADRAFGGLLSGSLVPTLGASFTNNTGAAITGLTISYLGEQWRLGATGRTDRLDFQVSTDATSLTTGTWADVDSLDFNGPISAGTAGALDGNAAANRTAISFTIPGLNIANGATFWIRWMDFNASGADDGLAVDDFTLTPLGAAVVADPKINEFSASTAGTDVEYVEIYGDPNTDYSAYTVLEIEGDSGAAVGTVDEVIALGTTAANRLYLVNLPANALENGTITLLLVRNFTGALNNDLDTNNDGVFDSTPWDAIVDSVAVNDGGAGDITYGVPTLGVGYDGQPFAPGGASRIPDGFDTDLATDWVRNDFDLAGIPGFDGTPIVGEAYNTPGAANLAVTPPLPELVINEIDYDQPGTDTAEFVEIRNNGAAAVSLDGVTLELVNGTGGGAAIYNTIVLPPAVSLAGGDYFVICANAATVANCDLDASPNTDFIQNGAPDAVGLRYNDVLLDAVSYEGNTGAPYTEGSGVGLEDPGTAGSDNLSIARCPDGFDSDVNNVDLTLTPITPGVANVCVDAAPAVVSTVPANGATDFPVSGNLTVTFSEPVAVASGWYALVCTSSGPVAAAVSGEPITFTINPDIDLIAGESCTLTIYADFVTDLDTNDPPDTMAADVTVAFSTLDVCSLAYTPIYAIQGSGPVAAITGAVTTQGLVVGDYEGPSPALRGFYIQDVTGDGDAATSDGIFVFNGNNDNVSLGDVVRVAGTAAEFQNQTQVSATSVVRCGASSILPVDVFFPVPSPTYLEQYEGMLVRLPQTMHVTEHFQLGRFGQVLLSAEMRLQQPTNVVAPGAPALALQAANDLNKVILDDALQNQNPDPIVFGRGGLPLSASNTLRGGDTVSGVVGVMTYTWSGNAASGNAYRLRPLNTLGGGVPGFQPANPRPAAVPDVGGTVKVVGMNLLNYFNTFSGCTNGVGGAPADCRGANNLEEFNRQWAKTVSAILAMNPDVLGVNEIENDGYGPTSAIADLVDRLNAATAPGTYAYVDVDAATGQVNALGIDGIKVGMIYQPAAVTPAGQTAALNSVAFVNGGDSAPRNRPSLAQAFQVNDTGAVFVVDVNHLKSKGSACDLPDQGDGQGNCNQVRLNAVGELMAWLATDPTGVGDPDVLLIGDYNSYAMEDPIIALQNGGFTHLIKTFLGPDAYSYVFDGQWGYLDHALASPALAGQVTGVADYHINADEPSVLDYNTDFKTPGQIISLYAPDEFRVSDHDPVIVGLLPDAPPMVSADPALQSVQYSDPIAPVLLTGIDLASDVPLSIATSWQVDGGAFVPGLPAGLALADNGCTASGAYATCTWTLSGLALTAPGSYVVRASVTDLGGDTSAVDVTIVVGQEDARVTYTGALYVATESTTSGNAIITLAATVRDISVTPDAAGDVWPGDIRNATVTFVDRTTNTPIGGCTDLPVGLVNPGDLQTGVVTCNWGVTIAGDAQDFTVGIVVDSYYTRDATADDVVIMVAKPLASEFVTGGGYLILHGSAGQLAGDDGSMANFGFNAKYNRSGKNLRGNATILVRRLEADGVVHVYQIKANALASLAVQSNEGTAVLTGRANIQDVTDPMAPVSVDGNAMLQIVMDDNGEPGAGDTLGITLWSKSGGLWFASRWDGAQTVAQYLDGGNLVVR